MDVVWQASRMSTHGAEPGAPRGWHVYLEARRGRQIRSRPAVLLEVVELRPPLSVPLAPVDARVRADRDDLCEGLCVFKECSVVSGHGRLGGLLKARAVVRVLSRVGPHACVPPACRIETRQVVSHCTSTSTPAVQLTGHHYPEIPKVTRPGSDHVGVRKCADRRVRVVVTPELIEEKPCRAKRRVPGHWYERAAKRTQHVVGRECCVLTDSIAALRKVLEPPAGFLLHHNPAPLSQ